jgi:hypothetical protein
VSSEQIWKKVARVAKLENGTKRLDKLSNEDARVGNAVVLNVTHNVDEKVARVGDHVRAVDEKVQDIVTQVNNVDEKVQVGRWESPEHWGPGKGNQMGSTGCQR